MSRDGQRAGVVASLWTQPPAYEHAPQDARAACKQVWEKFLLRRTEGEPTVHQLQAALCLPSVLLQLGMTEQPSLALTLTAMQVSASPGHADHLTLEQFQDAVLSLLTELQEQRRRCHTYRSWAMRLVLVLVLLGLVAVLVPFRAAGFVLLPALVLGPVAGILVVLEMDEVAKLNMQWRKPLKMTLDSEFLNAADEPQGMRSALSVKGSSSQKAQLAAASQVLELLARPAEELCESDVAPLYATLTGEELYSTANESDDEKNSDPAVAPSQVGAAAKAGDDGKGMQPQSTQPGPRKWSTELVLAHNNRSGRASCCSQGTSGRASQASRMSNASSGIDHASPFYTQYQSGPLSSINSSMCPPWQLPFSNSSMSTTNSDCPPWLKPLAGAASATPQTSDCPPWLTPLPSAASTSTIPHTSECPPWLTPLPHSPSATHTGTCPTPPTSPGSAALPTINSVLLAPHQQTRSGAATPSRFSPFAGLSRLGSSLSAAGSARHQAADSHRLGKRAKKAAEKAKHAAAEEAQRQLGWRIGGVVGDLKSGKVLERPGVPGLYFLENLPPAAERGSAVESSSEESEDLDYSPACLSALDAGLAAMNQGTMIDLIKQKPAAAGVQAGVTAGSSPQDNVAADPAVVSTGTATSTAPAAGSVPIATTATQQQQQQYSVEKLARKLTHRLGKLVGKLQPVRRTESAGGADSRLDQHLSGALSGASGGGAGTAGKGNWDKLRKAASKVGNALTSKGSSSSGGRGNSWDRPAGSATEAAVSATGISPEVPPARRRIGTAITSSLEEAPGSSGLSRLLSHEPVGALDASATVAHGASTTGSSSLRVTPSGTNGDSNCDGGAYRWGEQHGSSSMEEARGVCSSGGSGATVNTEPATSGSKASRKATRSNSLLDSSSDVMSKIGKAFKNLSADKKKAL